MLWLWGTIGLVLAVMFIGAWVHDRRHKGLAFGEGLENHRYVQDRKNDQDLFGGGTF